MREIIILAALVLWCLAPTRAQQFTAPSQYMLNSAYLNPAYYGEGELYSFTALYRSQWTGYKDYADNAIAPKMQLLTGLFNVNQTGHSLGFILSNDKTAYLSHVQAQLSYAYHINLTQKSTLSFGFRGGILSQSIDFNQYIIKHPDDPLIPQQKQTEIHPDMAIGLWFQHERYYAGLSTKGILIQNSYTTPGFRNEIAYVFTAGYHLTGQSKWKLTPSIQLLASENDLSMDGSLMANYDGLFWAGLSYRYQEAMAVILGFGLLEKKLHINYAFDYVIGNRETTAGASHEVMLNYRMGQLKQKKARAERRFKTKRTLTPIIKISDKDGDGVTDEKDKY